MKYLKFLVLLIFSLQLMSVSAQKSSWKDSLDINVYGYVKLDAFYDTRETVNGREGHFLLWPAAPDYDNLGAFPNTISFTTGTPVLPFSRNPQIRVIQYLGSFALIGVIQSQRDYPSFGPNPANPMSSIPSSEFLKNSGLQH
jgi:hypothetical protein